MILPHEVPHGRPVPDLTQTVNHLIRYCRSITPRPSASVGVETLANGTMFRVKFPAGTSQRGRAVTAEIPLNQFKVIAKPDGAPPTTDWLVSMNGGVAQAMFGTSTWVESVDEWEDSIPNGKRLFISLVYHIMANGRYVHAFDAQADFTVGTTQPANTAETCYFNVAVVESDGTVLQGHLGAVFLARPLNIVDVEDAGAGAGAGGGE